MAGFSGPAAGLAGRVMAISGGASGIGRETAVLAAKAGAQVFVGDLDLVSCRQLTDVADKQNLAVTTHTLDITSEESIGEFLRKVAVESDHLDGVVCAAGISEARPFMETTRADWDRLLGVNLLGTFLFAQACARLMIQGGRPGAIVTLSSGLAVTGPPDLPAYSASKAGVIALTKSMARALGEHGIRVNNVAPGATNTPLLHSTMGDAVQNLPCAALGQLAEARDVAGVILFFLSEASGWVTGQTLHVNGGLGMY
jgi:NAD(P)-dependent dehydrogenase (short-subunit alcohol dehydrogenase family)